MLLEAEHAGGPTREPAQEQAPVVSVVIPTFNRAALLPRALGSVLAQSFADFEVIVVDDGSDDDTERVVERIGDPRIRYVRREHGGISRTRNAGVALAAGEYLVFLDSDDEARPEWLATLVETLRSGADVVCCGVVKHVTREDGSVERVLKLPRDLGALVGHVTGYFLAGSYALRRSVFGAVGGFTEGLTFAENTDFSIRLAALRERHGWRIAHLDVALLDVYIRRGRAAEDPRARYESTRHLLRAHEDLFRADCRAAADYWSIAGVSAMRLGRPAEAARCLARACRAQPRSPRRWARLLAALVPPLGRRLWALGETS